MKTIAEKLKQNNLKATPQRLAIYSYLLQTKTHPCAETIYHSLESELPTLSLATVYKTLDTFKTQGLVQELSVGQDCFRFDAFTSPHPHLVCNKCGQVIDLDSSHLEVLSAFKKQIASQEHFIIESEQLYFHGICSQCQQ